MPIVLANRVQVTSTTTGTGALTLGAAVAGYQDFSVIGTGNQTYYTITYGSDWEVGIGTYTASGTTLSRDTVFASSNNNQLINWAAGSKTVFCSPPASTMYQGIPFGDNSEIGTNLAGYQPYLGARNQGIAAGRVYNNPLSSTYSLVYTTTQGYYGGILSADGREIHFVPYRSQFGQKVNVYTNETATYALAFSNTSGAYVGGALAPNGDIHFAKLAANTGQKIDASGTASTYGLVNASGSYFGAVTAPNGDVHFIPYSTSTGQKVSIAGVVSTYSLVYTVSNAYAGGVLAPNGDIHFVPSSAAIGQKISADGVVSTYSLAYTTTTAYEGGVLAPNGDIHFVPRNANRGQKINVFTGVVSTYSLVYTGSTAYGGGVLDSNGDIHFMPTNGPVGQKVSVNGVVSTYSLVFTASIFCSGGVLAPNGQIFGIPNYFNNNRAGLIINPASGMRAVSGLISNSFVSKF